MAERDRQAPRTARQQRAAAAARARGRTRATGRRRVGRIRTARTQQAARARLRGFRQATIMAVALTGLLLLLFAPEEAGGLEAEDDSTARPAAAVAGPGALSRTLGPAAGAQPQARAVEQPAQPGADPDAVDPEQPQADPFPNPIDARPVRVDTLARAAVDEARRTVRNLWYGFLGFLPRIIVASGALVLAWVVVALLRPLLRRAVGEWERANAAVALFGIAVWILAIGIAVSVLAGDIRALVGSLGLIGLALSWSLQTPIESFTGWLMNSFQGYYRVGDRVAVGEVFGDVYRIDFLTTTVWEIGTPQRGGFVMAEQPTGRLITFPNSEVLAGSIVNLTRDFPYVWDELAVGVANESDIAYAGSVLARIAKEIMGEHMHPPAAEYERILRRANLEMQVPGEPQVFVSLDDSWTTLSVRYLVGARERRVWKSLLAETVARELNKPEHRDRIISAYVRRQIQLIDTSGRPIEKESGVGS